MLYNCVFRELTASIVVRVKDKKLCQEIDLEERDAVVTYFSQPCGSFVFQRHTHQLLFLAFTMEHKFLGVTISFWVPLMRDRTVAKKKQHSAADVHYLVPHHSDNVLFLLSHLYRDFVRIEANSELFSIDQYASSSSMVRGNR